MWDSVVRVDIDHDVVDTDISVSLGLGQCGNLGVCATRATATTIRLARQDTEPAVFLGLQRSGSSIVVQHGREAVLRPGDFALYDTASPYTLLFAEGIEATFFRIPLAALALPDGAIRDVSAVRIGAGNPLAALTASYLARLADDPALLAGDHGAVLAVPTIELIRAAVTVQLGDDRLSRAPLHGTLATMIMADLRTHLVDPELSPASVAARQHISVCYLHRILQREGVRFGTWVRHHRLEGARRDLTDPASATVAAVAGRWAFTDAARFSKAFRSAYGVAPRDWRATHRGTPGAR